MTMNRWRFQKLTTGALLASSLLSAACGDKRPDVVRTRSTAALQAYQSCDDLLVDLRAHLSEEMRTQLRIVEEQLLTGGVYFGGPVAVDDAAAGAAESDGAARQEGVDFSGTNNQEDGVDEADFVKTDGYFLYVLNGGALRVLGVPQFGQLTDVSRVAIEGQPSELLLDGDRAVVFSRISPHDLPEDHALRAQLAHDTDEYGNVWYRTWSLTKLTVVDLGADRAAPSVVRELYLEGDYITAREVEGAVRMASYAWTNIADLRYWPELDGNFYALDVLNPAREQQVRDAVQEAIAHNEAVIAQADLDDFLPRLFVKSEADVDAVAFDDEGCRNFSASGDGQSRGFTSLLTLHLDEGGVAVQSDHVATNYPTIYSSGDTLLVAELAQDWWWYWNNEEYQEATNIHRFDVSGTATTYTGSGRVDGVVTDQFQLDVEDGQVRVAATVGQWGRFWLQEEPPPPTTHLTILEGEHALVPVGVVDGIAPGERLWSARFEGDKAYLVTFRNIDPLWTIDLSDKTNPRIEGELHVPGVSTYIHPLQGGHLLTIGLGGTDEGLDWSATQLSLFDVTDFSNPSLASTLSLAPAPAGEEGWTYAWSEATYEHKAFQYWGPMQLLAVPLSTYRYTENSYEYVSQLALVHAAAGDELSLVGTVDHSGFYNQAADMWWANQDIRRSVFMGDFIYAISDRAVTVHALDGLSLAASVELEGTTYPDYGYGVAE